MIGDPAKSIRNAVGGAMTMPIMDRDKAIRAALTTARGMADGGETKDKLAERPVGSATVGSLAKDFDDAIAHHLSLSMEDRKENSKRVKKELAEYIGPYGKLLGKNAKLMKAEAGFPMKGIAIAPFRRGGTVKPADSSPTLDRALRLTLPERLAATRVR